MRYRVTILFDTRLDGAELLDQLHQVVEHDLGVWRHVDGESLDEGTAITVEEEEAP